MTRNRGTIGFVFVVLYWCSSAVSIAVEPPSDLPDGPVMPVAEYPLLPDDYMTVTGEQVKPAISEQEYYWRCWAAPVIVGGDCEFLQTPDFTSSIVYAMSVDWHGYSRPEFSIAPNLGTGIPQPGSPWVPPYEESVQLARKTNLLPYAHQDGYWMSVWAPYGDFFPALGCLYVSDGAHRFPFDPPNYEMNFHAYRITDVDRETVYQIPAGQPSDDRLGAKGTRGRYGILTPQKLPPEYVCSRDKYVFTESHPEHPAAQSGCLQEKVIYVKDIKEGEDGVRTAEIGTVGKRLDQIYPFEHTPLHSGNGGGIIFREPSDTSPLYSTPFVGPLPNRPVREGTCSVLDRKPDEHIVLLQCRLQNPRNLGWYWKKWDEEGQPPVWIRYEPIVWRTVKVGDTIELGNNGDMRLSGMYKITRIEPTRDKVTIGDLTGRLIGWIEIDPTPIEVE